MKRTSTAVWKGTGKAGSGTISTQSHVLDKTSYSWSSRFETKQGTNPEELIAAAHAGCFTMKLSFLLSDAGFVPDTIETTAEVTLANDSISHSHLTVKAIVPGISKEEFEKHANYSMENCIVSRALKMKITMDATLTEKVMA